MRWDLSSNVSKRHLADLFYNEEQAKIAQKEDLQFPSSMIGDSHSLSRNYLLICYSTYLLQL